MSLWTPGRAGLPPLPSPVRPSPAHTGGLGVCLRIKTSGKAADRSGHTHDHCRTSHVEATEQSSFKPTPHEAHVCAAAPEQPQGCCCLLWKTGGGEMGRPASSSWERIYCTVRQPHGHRADTEATNRWTGLGLDAFEMTEVRILYTLPCSCQHPSASTSASSGHLISDSLTQER